MILATTGDEGADQIGVGRALGGTTTPHAIAEVILFFASDGTTCLTGAVIAAVGERTVI